MPGTHMMVVVSKAVFEKEARNIQVGEQYATQIYRSKATALNALGENGTLWLVTVRPGEVLWLVGLFRKSTNTADGWSGTNEISVTDITNLRGKLRFASDTGLPSEPGKLGMALQTPRKLTDKDVLALEDTINNTSKKKNGGSKMPTPTESLFDSLSQAYEILLGAPLASFDPGAKYALYHWDDLFCEEFKWNKSTLEKLAAPPVNDTARNGDLKKLRGLGIDRFRFDLGQSLFDIEDIEDEVGEYLYKESGKTGVLTGNALVAALTKRKLTVRTLLDEDGECYIPILGRVVSDGTLRDAMAAATWTMSAPLGLEKPGEYAEVDPKWKLKLSAIADQGLRAHFEMLCQTEQAARCVGALYTQKRIPEEFKIMKKLGCQVIAAWEFGEGQASQVVVQLA